MKTLVLCWLIIVLLPLSSAAQHFKDSLDYAEHVLTMRKKGLVVKHLGLTEAEKSSFWPVFDAFQRATKNYEIESLYMISKYTRQGQTFSEKELKTFSISLLKNDLAIAKLRQKYYKKISQALSVERASAFMQFDDTFRNVVRLDAKGNSSPITSDVYTRK